MNTVGIIAEYNPFHNGHLYHLKKIKEMYPDSITVLVLGGNFTQRGTPSILDKFTKTYSYRTSFYIRNSKCRLLLTWIIANIRKLKSRYSSIWK